MARRNYKSRFHNAVETLIEQINFESKATAERISFNDDDFFVHRCISNALYRVLIDILAEERYKKDGWTFDVWTTDDYVNDVKYSRWCIAWTDGKDYVTLTGKRK